MRLMHPDATGTTVASPSHLERLLDDVCSFLHLEKRHGAKSVCEIVSEIILMLEEPHLIFSLFTVCRVHY